MGHIPLKELLHCHGALGQLSRTFHVAPAFSSGRNQLKVQLMILLTRIQTFSSRPALYIRVNDAFTAAMSRPNLETSYWSEYLRHLDNKMARHRCRNTSVLISLSRHGSAKKDLQLSGVRGFKTSRPYKRCASAPTLLRPGSIFAMPPHCCACMAAKSIRSRVSGIYLRSSAIHGRCPRPVTSDQRGACFHGPPLLSVLGSFSL